MHLIVQLVNNPVDAHKILSHIPVLGDGSSSFVDLSELESRCMYSRSEIENYVRSNPYVVIDEEQHLFRLTNKDYSSLIMELINKCILSGISMSSFMLKQVLEACPTIQPFVGVNLQSLYQYQRHLVCQLLDDSDSLDAQVLSIHKHKLIQVITRVVFLGDNLRAIYSQ